MDRLEYYRPRGAQGNYKALLKLQHISSETVEVICYIHSGMHGYAMSENYSPTRVDAVVEGETLTYPLPPLKAGDCIFIRIHDQDIALPQINLYHVEEKRIQPYIPHDIRYRHDWYHFTDFEREHWDAIRKTQFKPIELVDMDGKSKRWPSLF